jgi:hypothetical protein
MARIRSIDRHSTVLQRARASNSGANQLERSSNITNKIQSQMTSAKKMAANRENARKSTGPRTERGKSQVRRNALRHGLAQMMLSASPVPAQIERIARAIAGERAPSLLYEQAVLIAESQVMLLHVRAARVAVVERARERAGEEMVPDPRRLIPGFPTDQEWAQALDDIACGRPRDASKFFIRGAEAVREFSAKVMESNENSEDNTEHAEADQRRRELQGKDNLLQPTSPDPSPTTAPDEAAVFLRALPELIRLDRYEQRALSRRARAIRRFTALSVLRPARARRRAEREGGPRPKYTRG